MNNLLDGLEIPLTQEAEKTVLGAVIAFPDAMNEIASELEKDDFSIHAHQLIWRAAIYLHKKNHPVDLVAISDILDRHKVLEEVGNVGYLTSLASASITAADIHYHAQIIKRGSAKRKGIRLAQDIIRATQEDEFDTPDEYFALLDSLFTHTRPSTAGRMQGFAETEENYFGYLASKEDNVLTGFQSFDKWSGGIGKGWLCITAGEPGVGKTAQALQKAAFISGQNVGQVLFWSQEMTFNQLKNRQLSNITGVNYSRIRRKELESHEIKALREAHRRLAETQLYVEDSSGVTIDHIVAVARQRERQHGTIGAIFVDYLTCMNIKQEKGENWSRAVGEVAKRFKWLAVEMQCPVFLLAQLNREGHAGKPLLKHLRDSGEIEQNADVVEFLWKDPEETSKDGVVVQCSIAKGREIGVNDFKYLFKGWIQRYEEWSGHVESVQPSQENVLAKRTLSNAARDRRKSSGDD